MKKVIKQKTKNTKEEVWVCERCGSSSLSSNWVPCPRGGCEAYKVGEKTVQSITTLLVDPTNKKAIDILKKERHA